MKPALLVIDMQKKYKDSSPANAASMEAAAEYIQWAIDLFTKKGLPIFHILHNATGPEAPSAEDFWELDSIAAPDRKDVIIKSRGSAFKATELQARLEKTGADMLVVTGYAAEYCALNTARDAEDLGWKVVMLRGGLASPEPENIPFVERVNELVSPGALQVLLS